MGAELGWDQDHVERELKHYQDRVAAELAAHSAANDTGAMEARNRVRDIRLTKV